MNTLPMPGEDRESWYVLACDIGKIMKQVGWDDWLQFPTPLGKITRRAVRYRDTWSEFETQYKEPLDELIKHFCFHNKWRYRLTEELTYLLQLRCYTVIRFVETLYVGPGKHGETLIPFPRQTLYPNLISWLLVQWFEDKGASLLNIALGKTFWSGKPRKWLDYSPKYRLPSVVHILTGESSHAPDLPN